MLVQKKKNSEEKLKITPAQIQILPHIFFPEWFGPKEIERIRFWNSYIKNQLKLIFTKDCGFWSQKGSNIWTLLYAVVLVSGI